MQGDFRASTEPAAQAATPAEVAIFAASIGLFIGTELLLSHAGVLLGRYLWLDENVTHLIVSDPSVAHSIEAVKGGVDTNPPVYHLLLRAFTSITRLHGAAGYRIFTLLCVWMMLVTLYAVLRRSFGRMPAMAGVLLVWSHPLIVVQTFEARFYGPLLAATAIFCFTIGRAPSTPSTSSGQASLGKARSTPSTSSGQASSGQARSTSSGPARSDGWREAAVGLASIFLCTIHYFGILSLTAIVAGDLLVREESWRAWLRRLWPVAAGPCALVMFYPFLKTQSVGLSVPTWADPFTAAGAGKFLEELFRPLGLPAILIVWWFSQILPKRGSLRARDPLGAASAGPRDESFQPVAGLSFLLPAVPAALILFSAAVLPALIPRYLITAVLGLAPPAAMLASRTRAWLLAVALVFLALLSFFDIRNYAKGMQSWQAQQRVMVDRVRGPLGDRLPIVTFARLEAYMIGQVDPGLTPRVLILDLRSSHRSQLSRYTIFESDMEQKVRHFYDVPPLITLDELGRLGPFHLVLPQPGAEADVPPLDQLRIRARGGAIYEEMRNAE